MYIFIQSTAERMRQMSTKHRAIWLIFQCSAALEFFHFVYAQWSLATMYTFCTEMLKLFAHLKLWLWNEIQQNHIKKAISERLMYLMFGPVFFMETTATTKFLNWINRNIVLNRNKPLNFYPKIMNRLMFI